MNVLNQFFDKIYCINLDSRLDKWTDCVEMFDKFGVVVERVSAFPPIEVSDCGLKNSELSLIKTHKKIIEDAKNENLNKILIFEDDVEFCDYLIEYTGDSLEERFKNSIPHLPDDWDVLYLGSGIDTGAKSIIEGEIYKLGFAHTTHAISINNKFFDTIINNLEQTCEPLDIAYCRLMNLYNMYSFYPNLISQRPSKSDIQNMNVNYHHLRNYYSLNK